MSDVVGSERGILQFYSTVHFALCCSEINRINYALIRNKLGTGYHQIGTLVVNDGGVGVYVINHVFRWLKWEENRTNAIITAYLLRNFSASKNSSTSWLSLGHLKPYKSTRRRSANVKEPVGASPPAPTSGVWFSARELESVPFCLITSLLWWTNIFFQNMQLS